MLSPVVSNPGMVGSVVSTVVNIPEHGELDGERPRWPFPHSPTTTPRKGPSRERRKQCSLSRTGQ